MENTNQEKLLDKIKKLLALAESSNFHEANLAMLTAHKLMKEHSINEGMLGIVEEIDVMRFKLAYKGAPWIRKLASSAAYAFSCCPVLHKLPRKYEISIIGTSGDLKIFGYMIEFALSIIEKLSKLNISNAGRSALYSYKIGIADGMSETLIEMAQADRKASRTESSEQEYGLIVKNKLEKLAAKMEEIFPFLKTVNNVGSKAKNTSLYKEGRIEGDKINFSKPIPPVKQKLINV